MSDPRQEQFSRPALRYRRFGGGYRREDVEDELEQQLGTVRRLDLDLEELRSHAARLESELASTRAELDAYRARETEIAALLTKAEEAAERIAPPDEASPGTAAGGDD